MLENAPMNGRLWQNWHRILERCSNPEQKRFFPRSRHELRITRELQWVDDDACKRAADGTCTDSGKLLRPRLVGRTIAGKPIKLPRNMNRISACSEKRRGQAQMLREWQHCA
jgi:hypothetical protein